MITHITKDERAVIEKILPHLDEVPFPIMGPAITKLLALTIIGAHEQNPDGDVWKVFNASVEVIRQAIEQHLADEAAKEPVSTNH